MLTLQNSEKILAVRRKTWFIFATTWASAVIMLFAPLFLAAILAAPKVAVLKGVFVPLYVFGSAFYEWAVWIWLFVAMINYYYDVFVITDERIVHIEQKGLFHRSIAELNLGRMQDVAIEQRGFMATILRFGDIRVQTAGEMTPFMFSQIDKPAEVVEIITRAQRKTIGQTKSWP